MAPAALDLAFTAMGEGDPVFVMHGLLGSQRNWQGHGKQLARRHAVHLIDMRNHGRSPWADEMSYAAMAADLVRLMDARGVERVSLIGHSMGGKAAMATALLHAGRVARLAVVDIAPVAYRSGFDDYIAAMQAIDLSSLRRRAEVESALAEAVPEPAIRSFLAQNLDSQGETLRWRANLEVLAAEMSTITGWPAALDEARFDGPALFLSGGASPYVRAEYRDKIMRLFSRAQMQVVGGAGHWLHAEAPQATAEALAGFLGLDR